MTHAINGEIVPALSGWQALGLAAATFVWWRSRSSKSVRTGVSPRRFHDTPDSWFSLLASSPSRRSALAQSWKVPTAAERCPSKWGADDTRGSANHMKPSPSSRRCG